MRETLIERWLPIDQIGSECRRENSTGLHPPPNRLHVWWARRPLIACRAAVLGSLLPAWSAGWPAELLTRFPDEDAYHAWFQRFLGILGDSVAARRLGAVARTRGIHLAANPFDFPRAFTVPPAEEDADLAAQLMAHTWGGDGLSVLDPMAGGGSIPFEASRYGLHVAASELNPVAAAVLRATLDPPFALGPSLAGEIRAWGKRWAQRVEDRLKDFFPREPGENIFAYVWAHTVACPDTGKPVPLSPNWWISRENGGVAVRLLARPLDAACRFELVRGAAARAARPDEGTVRRGTGVSPWTGNPIPDDYIKREAQAGRMGRQMYAVGVIRGPGREFRAPNEHDLAAAAAAEAELARRWPAWEAKGLIPTEPIPVGNKTAEPLRYGMYRWCDLFAPRQLLSLVTCLEELRALKPEIRAQLPPERARPVETYLALALDKAVDRNNRMCRWIPQRGVIANTFDRHDFSFKWSHAEFDAAHNLLPWSVEQVADAYEGLAKLAAPASGALASDARGDRRARVWPGNAADLEPVATGSVQLVCVDPPYYNNVQYAELSDFFYVWLKRSLGDVYPELFESELVPKDEEAVANPARFAGLMGKAADLADHDYERKMATCFAEMHRVLREDGILTVMFTHKRVEAWDALARALIEGGFTIRASWPIHTEFEHSLHQAKKNAAASTILLACRKRGSSPDPVWWDDIRGKVRQVAREKAEEYQRLGIRGVDLYLAVFGPALAVISEHWPVLTSETDAQGQPRPLRPEEALNAARAEVMGLRRRGLLLERDVQFDPVTDWYLLAWDAFKAEQFPADEARKLAIGVGIEPMEPTLVTAKRIIKKSGDTVVLQTPSGRQKKGVVDPDAPGFSAWIDAVHTAMLVYQEDGGRACSDFLDRHGYRRDPTFQACLQAVINAVPRTHEGGTWVRPEAEVAEKLRATFFPDLTVPVEPEPALEMHQLELLAGQEGLDEFLIEAAEEE